MAASVAHDNDLDVPAPPPTTGATGASRGWIRRLFGYCRRYPVISTLAVVGSCALALNALVPLLTKAVIDDIDAGSGGATGGPSPV